jgi:hypothetical protein
MFDGVNRVDDDSVSCKLARAVPRRATPPRGLGRGERAESVVPEGRRRIAVL